MQALRALVGPVSRLAGLAAITIVSLASWLSIGEVCTNSDPFPGGSARAWICHAYFPRQHDPYGYRDQSLLTHLQEWVPIALPILVVVAGLLVAMRRQRRGSFRSSLGIAGLAAITPLLLFALRA